MNFSDALVQLGLLLDEHQSEMVLRIAANWPVASWFISSSRNTLPRDGFDWYLLDALADQFNFTYEYIHCDFKWGNKISGSFDGITGFLVRGEADLGMTGMGITGQRIY